MLALNIHKNNERIESCYQTKKLQIISRLIMLFYGNATRSAQNSLSPRTNQ